AAAVCVAAAGIAVWRPPFVLPRPAIPFGGLRLCYRGRQFRLAAAVCVTVAGIVVGRPPFLLPRPALPSRRPRLSCRGRQFRLAASVFATRIRKHKNTALPGITGAAVFECPNVLRAADPSCRAVC